MKGEEERAPGVPHRRAIRSFVLRQGRMSPAQQRACDELLPKYGVAFAPQLLDFAQLFRRTAPVVLEIGFGMGETTVAMAAADPARDLIAVDVHTPGAGALVRDVGALGLDNVRVVLGDAVQILRDRLAPGSVDEVRIFFPDPWPKSRHHKRRLIAPPFVGLLVDRMRVGGRLHCATDWAPYAQQILDVVRDEPGLANEHDGYAPRPAWRPVTRFERQGLARGHQVFDVLARTLPPPFRP